MDCRQNTIVIKLFLSIILVTMVIVIMSPILVPCIASVIVAYILNPLVNIMVRHKISRTFSVAIVLITFIGILIAFFAIFIPIICSQLISFTKFLIEQISLNHDEITPFLSSLYAKFGYDNIFDALKGFPENILNAKDIKLVSDVVMSVIKNFSNVLIHTINSGINVSSAIILIAIVPLLIFYMMRDWPLIIKSINDNIPVKYKSAIQNYVIRIDNVISAYIRGQVSVCAIMALYYIVALSIVGLNYSLLVGFITGIMTFIPYLGSILCAIIILLVAVFQFESYTVYIIIFTIFILGQIIEGNIIVPLLVGKQVDLHPMWIIIGMAVCGARMGFFGILFSIPITAVVGVMVKSLIERYKHSKFYLGI